MRRVAMVLLSIAAVTVFDNQAVTKLSAVDKDNGKFKPGPASSYKGHVTQEMITIAAVPYMTAELASSAFGKVNPYSRGILPILVLIQNDTGKAVRVNLQAEFVDLSNRHIDAMPAGDVVLFGGVRKPPGIPGTGPNPLPFPRGPKRGPLNTWEIEGRAFNAKLIPAGEAAQGFVYFETSFKDGSKLYLTGLKDAATGKDFFYFEVPVERP
jgi:hypothetical protein